MCHQAYSVDLYKSSVWLQLFTVFLTFQFWSVFRKKCGSSKSQTAEMKATVTNYSWDSRTWSYRKITHTKKTWMGLVQLHNVHSILLKTWHRDRPTLHVYAHCLFPVNKIMWESPEAMRMILISTYRMQMLLQPEWSLKTYTAICCWFVQVELLGTQDLCRRVSYSVFNMRYGKALSNQQVRCLFSKAAWVALQL